MGANSERRRKARTTTDGRTEAQVTIPRSGGATQPLSGHLIDVSEWGIGLEMPIPLEVGSSIRVTSRFFSNDKSTPTLRAVQVVHCRLTSQGAYRCGCAFEDVTGALPRARTAAVEPDASFIDNYEILQISPNADVDTIQRVYRLLAQRYHPDNSDTGNEQAFQAVLHAYRVLSDPEKRAAYDVDYHASRSLRWKIFDQAKSTQGLEAEQRKRIGVLALLYTKMMEQPEKPGITVREIEEMLAIPHEHLEFAFWYLKKRQLIQTADNGRCQITIEGVDHIEASKDWKPRATPLLIEDSHPDSDNADTQKSGLDAPGPQMRPARS